MLKLKTKTICIAIGMVLCMTSVNAQVEIRRAQGMEGVKITSPTPELLSFSAINRAGRDVVYSEGFEGTTLPNLPTGWTVTASDKWKTYDDLANVEQCGDDFPPKTGTRMMGNSWWNSGNNWAFSAGFELTSGNTYDISFWYNAMGWAPDNEPDDFEVRIGDTPTAAAMGGAHLVFSQIGLYFNFDFIWREATATFTPTATGTYYFGFHDLRPVQTGLAILIDDILVTGEVVTYPPCPVVTNVVGILNSDNTATLTWTAPTPATGLANYKVYQNGTEVATVAVGTTTWTSSVLTFGNYTFEVSAVFNESEECEPVKVTSNVVEVPGDCDPVTNFNVSYLTGCTAELTWDEPTKKSRSELLWDNTNINDGTGGLISAYWSGNDNWVSCADDFDADGIWTIETIYSKGFSNAPAALPTKFDIGIYDNASNNKPGTELYRNKAIPVTDGANPVIVLPTPFTLPAPGKYWISIAGAYDASVPGDDLNTYRWNVYYGPTQIGVNYHLYDKSNIFGAGAATWLDASTLVSGSYSMWFKIEGTEAAAPYEISYNVYRDGELLVNTKEDSYIDEEFDPAEGHTWSVRVVCEDGSESTSESQTLPACACPAISNLVVEYDDDCDAELTWDAPVGVIPADYDFSVYRDGTLIQANITTTSFTDTGLDEFSGYTWAVTFTCPYGEESRPVSVTKQPCFLIGPPVFPLADEVDGDVEIRWLAPGTVYDWMFWCVDDEIVGRVGWAEDSGNDMTAAMRFTPEDFEDIGVESGYFITRVALGVGSDMDRINVMQIRIWEGGTSVADPGTLVHTQSVTNFGSFEENTMNEVVLTTPWEIDITKELRIGYRVVNTAGYPLGRDAGPNVADKGGLFLCPDIAGGAWQNVNQVVATWNWNWSIKAIFAEPSAVGHGKSVAKAANLENYIVFRFEDGDEDDENEWEEIATVGPTVTSYLDDDDLGWGVYRWAVKAEYIGSVLSEPSITNKLDIDMYVPFTVNLTSDTGAPVNGAAITLINQNEPRYEYKQIANSGTIQFPEVRRGLYTVSVTLANFHPIIETDVDIWAAGSISLELEEIYCPSVSDLTAEYFEEDKMVFLNWEVPAKSLGFVNPVENIDTNINVDDAQFISTDIVFSSVNSSDEIVIRNDDPSFAPFNWISWCIAPAGGIQGPTNYIITARFTPEDLAANSVDMGDIIRRVRFFPRTITNCSYTVRVWEGGIFEENGQKDPGTSVCEQLVTQTLTNQQWNEVLLNNPHTIDNTKELWIGIHVVFGVGTLATSCDEGPRVHYKGNLLYSGGEWTTLWDAGGSNDLNYNWSIAAFVETDQVTYNIYRGSQLLKSGHPDTFYNDNVAALTPGTYTYGVGAVHLNCNAPIATVTISTVSITKNAISNLVLINNGKEVVLEGEAIANVKVYNSLGQFVSNYEKTNTINVSRYNSGIYVFTVTTASGNVENFKVVIK